MASPKLINAVTTGVFHALSAEDLAEIVSRFLEIMRTEKDDWFYSTDFKGRKFFCCDNGEGGYTLMFA
ncbi:MAG: hypothetical protein HY335_10180, partial [Deinococcus sp.]|nr:hypothetical protein [Deinococcus sp.]